VDQYAVGFARPDRWVQQGHRADESRPWHAVEAHRPAAELDGEVELAMCGTIVQVWGGQHWERVGAGRTACGECRRLTGAEPSAAEPSAEEPSGAEPSAGEAPAAAAPAPAAAGKGGRRLRVVS
jgi:hypothetical protein